LRHGGPHDKNYEMLKNPTLDETRPENVFKSWGSPHLTTQFCNGLVRLNPHSKKKHHLSGPIILS